MHFEAMREWMWRFSETLKGWELRDTIWGRDHANSETHLMGMFEQVRRCTWRPWLSKVSDAPEGCDRVNWELNRWAAIELVQRFTSWRLWYSECGDALTVHDGESSEMHLEVAFKPDCRCTGGHDRVSLDIHSIDRDWAKLSVYFELEDLVAVDAEWAATVAETIFISFSIVGLNISTMYFIHWEPPGVCKRRRSVNVEASISGEHQTLGGHSGRPSE